MTENSDTMSDVLPEPKPSRRRAVTVNKPLLLSLAPSFFFGLLFIWRTKGFSASGGNRWVLFDDAMISMSYARTLAQTGELIWFPGAERVEGITNLLWTFYMSFLHLLGLSQNAVILTIMFTGLLFVLTTSWLTYRIAKTLTTNETLCITVAVVTSFTYSFVYWSLRGMEVGPRRCNQARHRCDDRGQGCGRCRLW